MPRLAPASSSRPTRRFAALKPATNAYRKPLTTFCKARPPMEIIRFWKEIGMPSFIRRAHILPSKRRSLRLMCITGVRRTAIRQMRQLSPWPEMVASAAPSTPQPNPITKSTSSTMLVSAAQIMAIKGVTLLPTERRKPENRLKPITSGSPAKMMRR